MQKLQFSQSLSLFFTCSDQRVKYQMTRWFPLTSNSDVGEAKRG